MRRIAGLVAVALSAGGFLAAACGPGGPAESGPPSGSGIAPSEAPTGAGAATAAAPSASGGAPTASAAIAKRFTFDPAPVLDPSGAGFDDKFVNPGAVIEVDGTLHMFANVFSNWPGRVRVPHLTSTDGRTWTLDPAGAVLDSDDLSMADPGIDVSTGYVADDGTWVLYFETVRPLGRPWEVWRATAPSPQGPWTASEAPVLPAGPAGTYDANGVTWPWVVRVGDRWAMYYAGLTGAGRGDGKIGVAFSDDGVTWQKHPEPVLVASEDWEFGSLDRPRVVRVDDGYVMVYSGRELTSRGLATSTDGLTWTKVPGPAIDRSIFPLPGGSWDAALLYRDGLLEYFLEIGSQTTKVYRATLPWP